MDKLRPESATSFALVPMHYESGDIINLFPGFYYLIDKGGNTPGSHTLAGLDAEHLRP